MADDKKNIGPEAKKPGEAPQEKKPAPVKDTPPAPEQPVPGAPQTPVVESAPKAQTAPTVESQPEEKAAPAPKVLDFTAAKNKAPAKEETAPEKKPVKEQAAAKPKRGRPAKTDKAPAEDPKLPRDKISQSKVASEITASNPQETPALAEPSQIVYIKLSKLHPFKNHPFKVRDDAAMQQAVESVREYGVLVPAIARPLEDGTYELISGHRRKHACELAGLDTMPVIIRNIDHDAATIIMVDSNLQRDNILPSERAAAYKMKLEAIKRQGARHDLTSPQVATKFRADDTVAKGENISGDTLRRYIRLTELEPELQQMVDEGKIGLTPAVEISYLKPAEQKMLINTIDSEQATPSLSQAQRMKKLSQEGKLNDDTMLGIMLEHKKPENWNLSFPIDKIKRYFPVSYTPQRMEETIIKLLESWMRKRQRDQQR